VRTTAREGVAGLSVVIWLAAVLIGNGVLVKSSTSVGGAANQGPAYDPSHHDSPGQALSWEGSRGRCSTGSRKVRTTVTTVAIAIEDHISTPV